MREIEFIARKGKIDMVLGDLERSLALARTCNLFFIAHVLSNMDINNKLKKNSGEKIFKQTLSVRGST
jgi:hypothetical protein